MYIAKDGRKFMNKFAGKRYDAQHSEQTTPRVGELAARLSHPKGLAGADAEAKAAEQQLKEVIEQQSPQRETFSKVESVIKPLSPEWIHQEAVRMFPSKFEGGQ